MRDQEQSEYVSIRHETQCILAMRLLFICYKVWVVSVEG